MGTKLHVFQQFGRIFLKMYVNELKLFGILAFARVNLCEFMETKGLKKEENFIQKFGHEIVFAYLAC